MDNLKVGLYQKLLEKVKQEDDIVRFAVENENVLSDDSGRMQWIRTKYDTGRPGVLLRDYLNVHAINDKELSWNRAVGVKGRTQGKKKKSFRW